MDYLRPSYIEKIPEIFKKYFDESLFENKPYPPTLKDANKYILFDVLKADKREIITMVEKQNNKISDKISNKNHQVKMKDFTKNNYYEIFNYNNWKYLSPETKLVALYWFYEEVCEELKIYRPEFYFLTEETSCDGAYIPNNHSFLLSATNFNKEDNSAYRYLEIIAHELNHAQYSTLKHSDILNEVNNKVYFDAPMEDNYNMDDDWERFNYYYDLLFYYSQPTEKEAYNYGLSKSKEIFDKTNKESNNYKNTSLTDLFFFREQNNSIKNAKKLFKYVIQDEFKTQYDKECYCELLLDDLDLLYEEIIKLDPEATFNEKTSKIKTKSNDAKLLEKIKEHDIIAKEVVTLDKEIEKDKKRYFEKYKALVAKEEIELY